MTELTIDVPRLRKELEYVTAHREQWSQGTWLHRTSCGTVGCFAGNVALNAGYLPVYERSKHTTTLTVRLSHEHDDRHVADVAAEVLGLSVKQLNSLFAATNTLYDLWNLASLFTNGEIEVPAEVEAEKCGDVERPASGYEVVERNHQAGNALRTRLRERRWRAARDDIASLL